MILLDESVPRMQIAMTARPYKPFTLLYVMSFQHLDWTRC